MKRHFIERWNTDLEKNGLRVMEDLNRMKIRNSEGLDQISGNMHKQVFEEIDCLDCANCCKTTPAILTVKDIKRIAGHLKIAPKIFRRKYVLEDINGELSFKNVPCVFLESDNKCSVYEYRPESCRDYPHTSTGSFNKRISLHQSNLTICPAVFEIIKRMASKLK